MTLGVRDLVLARIGRDYAIKEIGQTDSGLTAARRAIPCTLSILHKRAKIFEQRAWIARAELRVVGRALGKMIFKLHSRFLLQLVFRLSTVVHLAAGALSFPD